MLEISEIGVSGYRSLRKILFPLDRLNVFAGANGTGKTNLYRALQLLQSAAKGTLARDIALEGGMKSAIWTGKRKAGEPVTIAISVLLRDEPDGLSTYRYEAVVGFKPPVSAMFENEAHIKSENLTASHRGRTKKLLDRQGATGHALDCDGVRQDLSGQFLGSETALGALADAGRFPDLHLLRRTLTGWRFYHDLATGAGSPLRRPCLAVATPMLSSDGSDLAAVFATLAYIREDTVDLDAAVADAFPGARLVIPEPDRYASFGMIFPDHPQRLFEASELSDGTLRYLALMGVLLSYRLPPFVALNEPETSLHPDLLPALGRLVARAADRTQIWLVTHSQPLAEGVALQGGIVPRRVVKRDGETWLEGLNLLGAFTQD